MKVVFKSFQVRHLISSTNRTFFATPKGKEKTVELEPEGVVYCLECLACQTSRISYIGETGRKLSHRLNEHFTAFSDTRYQTEVAKHDLTEHGKLGREHWKCTILEDGLTGNLKRKIQESIHIKNTTKTINQNKGLAILSYQQTNKRDYVNN